MARSDVVKPSASTPLISVQSMAAVTALLAIAIQLLPETGVPSVTGPAAKTKPYTDYETFYPHYKMEHTDATCRTLHVVGTTITCLVLASQPQLILAAVFSSCVGVFLSGALRGLPTGFLEFGVLGAVFFLTSKALTGSVRRALLLPLIGYTFAWVGHFYFEHNKPATFIYPTYSLISDYRMFFNILTGREGL